MSNVLHALRDLAATVASTPGVQELVGAAVGGALASLATVRRSARQAARQVIAEHELRYHRPAPKETTP